MKFQHVVSKNDTKLLVEYYYFTKIYIILLVLNQTCYKYDTNMTTTAQSSVNHDESDACIYLKIAN
jgi:hypothetical protein